MVHESLTSEVHQVSGLHHTGNDLNSIVYERFFHQVIAHRCYFAYRGRSARRQASPKVSDL